MSPYRRLFQYVARYKRAFVIGLACSFITTGISLLAPMVLQRAVDDLTQEVTRAKLILYASQLLGIGLVGGVFRFWTRRIIIGASRGLEYDMRNDLDARRRETELAAQRREQERLALLRASAAARQADPEQRKREDLMMQAQYAFRKGDVKEQERLLKRVAELDKEAEQAKWR